MLEAQNGEEALAIMAKSKAEIVIPDLGLPDLDGLDVIAQARQAGSKVPIIVLSATLERRFGGPEDMHLLKGYSSIDDLVTALRSLEAKRRGKPVVVDARDFADASPEDHYKITRGNVARLYGFAA